MIAVVDYGLGNTQAFLNTFERLDHPASRVRSADELEGATKIVLPGVGAFDHAMELLEASGMRKSLEELVQPRGIPLLGVCVGMQILAEHSDEGSRPGLGWIKGNVKAFDCLKEEKPEVIPHMGWNDVRAVGAPGLFAGLDANARFYFLHSYFFQCVDHADVIAEADYGVRFASAVGAGNVYGVQFHPEKSHHWGSRLLRNFAEL